MGGRTSKINLPPTNFNLIIASPVSYGVQLAEEYGYISDSYSVGEARGITFYRRSYSTIIIALDEDATPGLIAHESLHVLNWLYKAIGQKTNINSDELDALLLEYIVDNVYKHLCKKKSYKK